MLIPDTDEDLTWHAFLGHSLDMQGFRAAEFVGVDPLTKAAPKFRSLQARGIGVPELAALWGIPALREHLLTGCINTPFETTLGALKAAGHATGDSLADALRWFPYVKSHWRVRAYLENSTVLERHGFSFRRWLEAVCRSLGETRFPPPDFRLTVKVGKVETTLERAIRLRLEHDFYRVGPAIAAYMIADWQLWLWREGRTAVFDSYKQDAFHQAFVNTFGRGVVPVEQEAFTTWWSSRYPAIPVRLANECIWLGVELKTVKV